MAWGILQPARTGAIKSTHPLRDQGVIKAPLGLASTATKTLRVDPGLAEAQPDAFLRRGAIRLLDHTTGALQRLLARPTPTGRESSSVARKQPGILGLR